MRYFDKQSMFKIKTGFTMPGIPKMKIPKADIPGASITTGLSQTTAQAFAPAIKKPTI